MQSGEDELRDLSVEDAEELRAFLDKRRWFEAKLKILEAAVPIYPFLHPNIRAPISRTDQKIPEYLVPGSSTRTLPSIDQVKNWQEERDALEEEVYTFDGGDLDKMKQKTRQVTLIPLTAPSTHLVSITLDLIVVVDRLLTLLRRRMELLELTALRLRWDQLRWEIMSETAEVRAEIKAIVEGKGRWKPPTFRGADNPSTPGKKRFSLGPGSQPRPRVQTTPLPTPVSKLGSSTSLSSDLSTVKSPRSPSNSPEDRRRASSSSLALSAMRDSSTPTRASLQLPILHSQISNVEIRHSNLKSTLVTRSGKILDKMVDVAGPLRGLGGILGPIEEETEGGAVPDELLDLQDVLEEDVQRAGAGIVWCRGLEEQWKFADTHFASSRRTKALVQGMLFDLVTALQGPFTVDKTADFGARLSEVELQLPGDPKVLMPHIDHSDGFDTEDHSGDVLEVLLEARDEAAKLVDDCRDALTFYGKLVESQARLATMQRSLQKAEVDLASSSKELAPLLSNSFCDGLNGMEGDSTSIFKLVESSPGLIEAAHRTQQSCSSASRIAQEGIVLAMSHRALLKQAPKCLLEEGVGIAPELVNEVDELSAAVLDQAKTVEAQGADATRNSETLGMVHSLYLALNNHEPAVRDLVRRPELAVDQLPEETSLRRLETDCERLGEGFAAIRPQYAQLLQRIGTAGELDQFRGRLKDRVSSLDRDIDHASQLLRLVTATKSQADFVSRTEKEAEDLLALIGAMRDQAESNRNQQVIDTSDLNVPEALSRDLSDITAEISAWDSSLAHRMIWTSKLPSQPSTPTAAAIGSGSAPRDPTWSATQPPLTPPASPTPGAHSGHSSNAALAKSRERDSDARQRVNEASGRVQSALMQVKQIIGDLPFDKWQTQMRLLLDNYTAAERTCGQQEGRLARDLTLLSESTTALTDIDTLRNGLDQCVALQREAGPSEMRLAGPAECKRQLDQWILARPASSAKREVESTGHPDLEQRFTSLADKATDLDRSIASALEALQSRLQEMDQERTERATNEGDVFGPMTTVESSNSVRSGKLAPTSSSLPSLIQRLDDMRLDLVLRPTKSQIHDSPQLQGLPRSPLAQRIKLELQAISTALDTLDHIESDDSAQLRTRLDEAFKDMPLLDQLVRVASTANECDNRFSDLIEAIDEVPLANQRIEGARDKANSAVVRLKVTARPVDDDFRVSSTVKRVGTAWTELESLAEDTLHPSRATSEVPDDISDRTSAGPSRLSMDRSIPGSIPARSRQSSRQSTRTTSNPLFSGAGYLSPTKSSQARSASDSIRPSASVSRIPRARTDSIRSSTSSARLSLSSVGPSFSSFDLRSSRIPTPTSVRMSATPRRASGATADETPRPRRSALLSSSTNRHPKRAYVADPKSKLDVAVGKVVNKLNMDVPVRPVGQGAGDQWKDQSGKYWIGAEGRAKLCFCRILRSKTVMVRVGGGWVELSRFLLEHFSSSLGSWQSSSIDLNSPGLGIGSSTPIPITSASLQTPAKSRQPSLSASLTSSTRPSVGRKVTPARQALVANQIDEMFTPVREQEVSPGAGASASGGASPL